MFGSTSWNTESSLDRSSFVHNPYLRTNYIASKFEKVFGLKNQCKIKNLPDPLNPQEDASKSYVDEKFNEPKLIKKTLFMLTSTTKFLIFLDLLKSPFL